VSKIQTQDEFKVFITAAERDCRFDNHLIGLRSWETNDLTVTFALTLVQSIEITAWAIDDDGTPPGTIATRAYNSIRSGRFATLRTVYEACNSQILVIKLLDRLLILDEMARELYTRTPGAVGRELMNLPMSSCEKLFEALKIKLPDTDAAEDDLKPDTLQQFAEKLHVMRSEADPQLRAVHAPSAEIFGIRTRLTGPRWQDWPRMQALIVSQVLNFLGPVLSGNVETIPNFLQQYVTRKPATEQRKRRRHRALLRKRTIDEESNVEQQVRDRKAKQDLVLTARARWGDKIAKAVAHTILEGKTQKEAASLEGIHYQPFRRKMSELRRLGLGNKPK
jgi:hypothetical protein